jgi:hypothetical protein
LGHIGTLRTKSSLSAVPTCSTPPEKFKYEHQKRSNSDLFNRSKAVDTSKRLGHIGTLRTKSSLSAVPTCSTPPEKFGSRNAQFRCSGLHNFGSRHNVGRRTDSESRGYYGRRDGGEQGAA